MGRIEFWDPTVFGLDTACEGFVAGVSVDIGACQDGPLDGFSEGALNANKGEGGEESGCRQHSEKARTSELR